MDLAGSRSLPAWCGRRTPTPAATVLAVKTRLWRATLAKSHGAITDDDLSIVQNSANEGAYDMAGCLPGEPGVTFPNDATRGLAAADQGVVVAGRAVPVTDTHQSVAHTSDGEHVVTAVLLREDRRGRPITAMCLEGGRLVVRRRSCRPAALRCGITDRGGHAYLLALPGLAPIRLAPMLRG
jgi:hypothetical protein